MRVYYSVTGADIRSDVKTNICTLYQGKGTYTEMSNGTSKGTMHKETEERFRE